MRTAPAPDALSELAANLQTTCGLQLGRARRHHLQRSVQQRAQQLGLNSIEDYVAHLHGPAGRTEYPRLIDHITPNETFFFRDLPQLKDVTARIIHPLVAARRRQGITTFRIWSAATGSGDELYTLALLLKDEGLLHSGMRFELLGTDISPAVLESARAATYTVPHLRHVPTAVRRHNFIENADGTATLKLNITRLTEFRQLNLLDAARIQRLGTFDIIFARNIFSHLTAEAATTVKANLRSALADDGTIICARRETS